MKTTNPVTNDDFFTAMDAGLVKELTEDFRQLQESARRYELPEIVELRAAMRRLSARRSLALACKLQ